MFFKIGGLKRFAIFTGKHLYWSLFLIRPATLLKIDPNTCFPVNIGKFLWTPVLTEHPWVIL